MIGIVAHEVAPDKWEASHGVMSKPIFTRPGHGPRLSILYGHGATEEEAKLDLKRQHQRNVQF